MEILEGDGSVVNVIEPHPHLPLIAVSGIDTTVKVRSTQSPSSHVLMPSKLFAPGYSGPSKFSRMGNLTAVTDRNALAARRTAARRTNPAQILLHYQRVLRMLEDDDVEDGTTQCTNQ